MFRKKKVVSYYIKEFDKFESFSLLDNEKIVSLSVDRDSEYPRKRRFWCLIEATE